MFARPVINGNTIARSGCLARLRHQPEALARETGACAEERPCFQAPMQPLACAVFATDRRVASKGAFARFSKTKLQEIVIGFLALWLTGVSTPKTATSSRNEAAQTGMRQSNSFRYEATTGLSITRTIRFAKLRPAQNFRSTAFSLLKETRYELATMVRTLRGPFGDGYFQNAGSR